MLNGLESIHAEVHRGEMIWSLAYIFEDFSKENNNSCCIILLIIDSGWWVCRDLLYYPIFVYVWNVL